MKDNKLFTSLRLTEDAMRLRELLSEKLGVNLTAVIELAIRELAKREDIK